jgi:cell division protein FtsL
MSAPELVGPALKPTPPETPRHLRLVGAAEYRLNRRRRRIRVGGVALTAFVIALLFAAVGMHVVLTQNQFRLDKLNNEATAQQAQYQQLRLQVDQLSSPQRIIGTAEGKLGMVEPASVTYLRPASATPGTTANTDAQGGPAPATAPADWSTIKPELAANP